MNAPVLDDSSSMIHLFRLDIVVAGVGYLYDDYDSGGESRDDCDSSRLESCDRMNIDDYCFGYSIGEFDLVVEEVVGSGQ